VALPAGVVTMIVRKHQTSTRFCLTPGCSIAACSLAIAVGCTAGESTEHGRSSVIYGNDSRVAASDYSDPQIRAIASNSLAALIHDANMDPRENDWILRADTLREVSNLCPEERFASFVAAAFCTAVLVDDLHVMTAGHCLVDRQGCRDGFKLAFGYVGDGSPLETKNVFDCVAVEAFHHDAWDSPRRLDYALLRLDRSISAPLFSLPVGSLSDDVSSEHLLYVGANEGTPMTVDDQVFSVDQIDLASGHFTVSADVFHGGSGGAILDRDRNVVGIVSGGADDYEYDAANGCFRTRLADPSADDFGEQATIMSAALDDLCGRASSCLPVCSQVGYETCGASSVRVTGGGCAFAQPCRVPREALLMAGLLSASLLSRRAILSGARKSRRASRSAAR
jgi:hypothetical protein